MATELFLRNVVLGVEVRWTIRDTKDCSKVSNQYLSNSGNSNYFNLTFGIVRSGEGDIRAVVDMDYITSNKLGHLVRRGFIVDVYFTYVVRSVQHITILLNFRLFNVPSMM